MKRMRIPFVQSRERLVHSSIFVYFLNYSCSTMAIICAEDMKKGFIALQTASGIATIALQPVALKNFLHRETRAHNVVAFWWTTVRIAFRSALFLSTAFVQEGLIHSHLKMAKLLVIFQLNRCALYKEECYRMMCSTDEEWPNATRPAPRSGMAKISNFH
uniref:Uncharacterized protein n=1 Tax=Parascaris univalens TaxID=6257 RepID=A0A914ZMP9_PARUN